MFMSNGVAKCLESKALVVAIFVLTEEVIERKKKIKATCKFCPASYIGNATEMVFHLINQCKKIGPEARRTIDKLAVIKKNGEEPPSNKVTKRPGSSFSSSPSITNYFG
uniref:Uncharacterized protein n=1 Tax=Ditylenchus dipsaci TaxID=166011 RepID=A0A915DY27_9BILA